MKNIYDIQNEIVSDQKNRSTHLVKLSYLAGHLHVSLMPLRTKCKSVTFGNNNCKLKQTEPGKMKHCKDKNYAPKTDIMELIKTCQLFPLN